MYIEYTSDPIFFVFPAEPYTPILLYYAHVPAMIMSLLMGIFIFRKTKYSLTGRNLLLFFSFFFLWALAGLICWSNQYSEQLYVWTLFEPLMVLMTIFAVYFFHSFLYNRNPSVSMIIILNIAALIVICASVFESSINGFEVYVANATIHPYYLSYAYVVSLVISLLIPYYWFKSRKNSEATIKKQADIIGAGLVFFLWSFVGLSGYSTYQAYIGSDALYMVELYGLFAMYVFLASLFYVIIKYDSFGIKFKDAQLIISVLILLVGAQVLFFKDFGDKFFVAITLIIVAGLGYLLMRIIKKDEERKRLDLGKANLELQKLDKAKDEFINLASHQLKTPLTIIKGVASLMVDGKIDKFSPEEKQQFYQSVWNKSLKLENIVCGILDAAAFSNEKTTANEEKQTPINIKQIITKIIDDLKFQSSDKNVALVIQCEEGFDPVIKGQQRYIEEAFTNIIHNAIKYAPSGKGKIEILIKHESSNDLVMIQVKDNGIGIPAKDLPNMFTRFYRAENAKNIYTDGTGLGLYIVKEIIEGHGGKVSVESEINNGSTFSVMLPLSNDKEPDMKQYIINQCTKDE